MAALLPTALSFADPLLTLAILLMVAIAMGALARRAHLPGITGQIVAGVVMGPAVLGLLEEERIQDLVPLTNFALGLMAVTVGAHLNLRRLRNAGKRLFLLLITESLVTPILVFGALWGLGSETPGHAALFATCAIATAPATIVALVAEARAKGVFVKTLVAAVALNNLSCIFLFEVARAVQDAFAVGGNAFPDIIWIPALQLGKAIAIGGGLGVLLELMTRAIGGRRERLATAAVIGLMFASGLADFVDTSPLLTCLFLGFTQTNLSRTRDRLVDSVFADFQPVILAVFFTLAGMHLSFAHLREAGLVAALFFGFRVLGKLGAAWLAMRWAHAPARVRQNLGLALIPQAGVAVALVILIQNDPAFAGQPIAELFATVVLTVVTVNEIVGPILTRLALMRSREVGMDRTRLIDFIQEENIVVNFAASSKQEAIEKLVDLMSTSHHLTARERSMLLNSTLHREEEASTCLGNGLSVPHGILPSGQSMVGVMGISREGLRLNTPDGEPVHCMVLLGTSIEDRDRHLQVLAALARTVGTDPSFQAQIFNAKSAAHVSEILHGEESVDFNYFLEDDPR